MKGGSFYPAIKRLMDITGALCGLVVLSPLLITVAILLQKKLGSPVIFKQTRAGYKGKPFDLYKFRTMTNEKGDRGELLPPQVRLTPFGKCLRRYSLDEVPQLLNVLQGELSLVGPRPLHLDYIPLYSKEQAKRLLVKPGITGWAQINGRNNLSWEEKFSLDVWYVENRNILLDIRILLRTVLKVFRAEDVKRDGSDIPERFTGNN